MKRWMQRFTVQYRRKREGKTNYRKRLKLVVSGRPRLVIRPSLRELIAHITLFEEKGDKTIASAHTKELIKLGWPYGRANLPASYLVGLLIGKRALKQGIGEAIFDPGQKPITKGNRILACLKGAVDAGLKIPHSPHIFPSNERLEGEHIITYAKKCKEPHFSKIRARAKIENLKEVFADIKKKILGDKNAI